MTSRLVLFGVGLPGVSLLLTALAAADSLPSFTTLIAPVLFMLLLIFVNGLFVAAEYAIASVRESELEQLADAGNATAGQVLNTLETEPKLASFISTAQLVVTLASLAVAMYGVPIISRFVAPYLELTTGLNPAAIGAFSFLIALLLLVYFHVVLGEMVPKALALSSPSKMVLLLNRVTGLAGSLLGPFVRLLNNVGNFLLSLFDIPPAVGHERLMAADELELIVTESAEGGLIEDDEQEIILNIFDFSERTVGQVMTPRRKVQALSVDCTQAEIIRIVTESSHSRFPVYEGDLDHIVGILHLKDLIRLTLGPQSPFDLRLILRTAPDVPEDFRVDRLLAGFKHEKLHMAIVRDEFGGLAGVVTLEDLVEEVVGEVRDEFDVERDPYHLIEPGVIEVSGDYLLDYLADDVYLGEEDSLPDVETVGGLIVALLGRPPVNGDVVTYHRDIRFTVLDIDRLAVTHARVEFPSTEAERAAPESEDKEEE